VAGGDGQWRVVAGSNGQWRAVAGDWKEMLYYQVR